MMKEISTGSESFSGALPGAALARREFLKTAAGAALGLACGLPELKAEEVKGPEQSAVGRPNILWITVENTCPQFLDCYESETEKLNGFFTKREPVVATGRQLALL
jgi:hypothetical protein